VATNLSENPAAAPRQSEGAAPAKDRLPCDLVMKGGITSGIVYPRLIARLAGKYQFRNVGGTSAGAIAAAACAAAEYGRQHGHSRSFERLSELPQELQQSVGTPPASRLFHLFQPAPQLGRHFSVLMSMLNRSPLKAAAAGLKKGIEHFPAGAVSGLLVALLLALPIVSFAAPGSSPAGLLLVCATLLAGWGFLAWAGLDGVGKVETWKVVAWAAAGLAVTAGLLFVFAGTVWNWRIPFSIVGLLVALVLALAVVVLVTLGNFAMTLVSGIHGNRYGICGGRTTETGPDAQEGLTDWLTGYLNELAGKAPDGPPLTFGDLWGSDSARREVNLEVMTTAVSQQMCFSIPFREGSPHFYYDEQEWETLFPAEVMKAIREYREHDAAAADVPEDFKGIRLQVIDAAGKPLRRLPPNEHLPVVVAVRMSLSFPVLLSAIPLHAIDWSLKANEDAAKAAKKEAAGTNSPATAVVRATRVWFSDGGIASNMPLHFFDSALPGHPTFAVNLKSPHPDHPIEQGGRVYLPDSNREGRLRYWPEPNDHRPFGGLAGFLNSIIKTMQNWRDEIQFPYPGYRDRIVQISQRDDEGGLNLNMPEEAIRALSEAGELAADALIASFHPGGAKLGEGWRNHEEVRLTTFLGIFEQMGISLNARLHTGNWINVAKRVETAKRYTAADGQAATAYLGDLQRMGDAMVGSKAKLEDKSLKPRASLRISPRI
jgi:predicted acylesterase/phospholipase RssA